MRRLWQPVSCGTRRPRARRELTLLNILTVVGARPQFVKAAVVSPRLRERHHEILLHTGQHYDDALSKQFFDELAIPAPDYELRVGSGPHGAQTGQMLTGIE